MPQSGSREFATPRGRSESDSGSVDAVVLRGANRILEAALVSETEQQLGEVCLTVAEELTGSEFGFIGELSPDGILYAIALSDTGWDACAMYDQTGHRRPPAQFGIAGLHGHVLSSGESLLTNDPTADEHSTGTPPGHPGLRAFLGVPLARAGRTVGLVALANRPGGYSEEDRRVLESLAPSIAAALQSKRAMDTERERLRLADELTRIEADIHSSLDPERIIQQTLAAGARVLGADTGAITIYEPPVFRCVYSVGFDPDIAGLVIPEEKERHGVLAIRSKEPVVVEDTQTDGRVDKEHLAGYQVFAVIVVPMPVGGEAIGNIYYNFSHSRSFSDAEIRFVRSLSSSLALAMENARLFAVEQASRHVEEQRAERMSLLRDIADVGASSWDVSESARRQVDAVSDALQAQVALLYMGSPDGRLLLPIATVGIPEGYLDQHFGPVEVNGPSASAAVFRSGRPALVRDIEDSPHVSERARAVGRGLEQRRLASLALNVSGATVGVLSLAWPEPREFAADEAAFLDSLASEIALGLRNAQLFEAERSARQQAGHELETTALLLKAADALSQSMDLGQVLEELVTIAIAATHRSRVTVSLYDPVRDELVVQMGVGDGAVSAGAVIPLDPPGLIGSSIREMRTMVADYGSEEVPTDEREGAASIGAEIALLVPLLLKDEVIGHVWVDEPNIRRPFTEREIKIIEGLSSSAAVAIERARLYEQRTEQARYAEVLNRINAALHSSLDFDEIMDRVGDEVGGALGAVATAVHVRREGRWELSYEHGLPSRTRASLLAGEASPVSKAVIETRTPLVVNGSLPDYAENASILEHLGMSALIAAPLFVRGDVAGVLYAGRVGSSSTFDENQIDFMRRVASTLSLALSNAAAYQNERSVAHALQEAMLTLPASVRGVRFASEYRAASEAALVGGDFYDLFEIDDDFVGVTIGDVAGKGLGAAVTTSLVKNAIRAQASGSDCEPRKILAVVNDVVFRDVPTEVFSTVFFGVLSRDSGTLRYANAGQVMAMMVSFDGTVEELPPTGPILGAFEGVRYEEHEEKLGSSTLVLFTDGLTEARRGSEQFGGGRLRDLLSAQQAAEPRDCVSEIMGQVQAFTDGHLRDDVALLVLARDTGDVDAVPGARPSSS